jgi:hypothetical protein
MGLTRFLISSRDLLPAENARRVYFTGLDAIPVPSQTELSDEGIEVERDVYDSGNYHVPWMVDGYGELMLSTASLMERDAPYVLAVELARGALNQLRNQMADWAEIGLLLPEGFRQRLRQSTLQFVKAATAQTHLLEAERYAQRAIAETVALGDLLASAFVDQAFNVRKRQTPHLPTWLGGALPHSLFDHQHGRQFLAAFNAAAVGLTWKYVEPSEGNYQWRVFDQQLDWCHAHQLQVMAGPVLKLDATGCPDWLCLWEGDFENLVNLVTDYVETVARRYQGRVAVWNCAARFSTGEALALSEEECLHLAARSVEVIRRVDPQIPCILTFDRPWAEYLRHGRHELAPLHVADALLRSELGLSGLGLELNLAYESGGSPLHNTLAINRLLDWWSGFGLPLYLSLALPSASVDDPKAQLPAKVRPGRDPAGWTADEQCDWTQRLVALAVAKPAVSAVFWNQWRDDERHDFPHGGLHDQQGKEKPALTWLRRFRRRHLQ